MEKVILSQRGQRKVEVLNNLHVSKLLLISSLLVLIASIFKHCRFMHKLNKI